MKILFLIHKAFVGTGSDAVMRGYQLGLSELGVEVESMVLDERDADICRKLLNHGSVDYIHCWNTYALGVYDELVGLMAPTGLTVHGFVPGYAEFYANVCKERSVDMVMVMDYRVQMELAELGVYSRFCPQTVDLRNFSLQPYPDKFSIGFVGRDKLGKHFDIAVEMATRMKIPITAAVPAVVNIRTSLDQKNNLSSEEVLASYRSMSCYVSSCYMAAAGPITVQEALKCGRPILTTRNGMLENLITPGIEGEFFNGSVEDGITKLSRIRDNYDEYAANAREWTPPPDYTNVGAARLFLREVEDVILNSNRG